MSYTAVRFVSAWPSVVLRDSPSSRGKGLTQCLWGDWVGLYPELSGHWHRVRTRGRDGWLQAKDLTEERPLEINFVDIGQGDGTFIVTPNDEMIIIDAGATDNMHRFLKWRFNLNNKTKAPAISKVIITHPDLDHYDGFSRIFRDSRFQIGEVLHSGIVERNGDEPLGKSMLVQGQKYLTGIAKTRDTLHKLLSDNDVRGKKRYPNLLWTALTNGRVNDIRAVSAGDVLVQSQEFGKELRLEVMAPVTETVEDQTVLRWFAQKPGATAGGDIGKTKNGHSVVTLLSYGKVRILLGGDLNTSSEEFLMAQYQDRPGAFNADIAKACHHGSSDFTTRFLDWISPIVTVVSSGDDEPHGHPRADTLGTLGKHSRGLRPLIFSTELARSAPERIISETKVRADLLKLADAVAKADTDDGRASARARLTAGLETAIQRTVSMYGHITVRTDGNSVIIAQRLERARGTTKWDIYRLERQTNGTLAYVYE
jgi:beta-lactamase superfamily II metal-dependent hydrolase